MRRRYRAPCRAAVAAAGLLLAGACLAGGTAGAEEAARAEPDDSGAAALTATWGEDLDCAGCHTAEAESLDDEDTLYARHAAFDLACAACHDDAESLEKVHSDLSKARFMPKRLKKTEVSSEVCLTCHDQDKLAEATADLDLLTDDAGTTVNPHALPDTRSGAHDQIVCASCHGMHDEEDAVEKTARNQCLTCHHANVYECYTCHD